MAGVGGGHLPLGGTATCSSCTSGKDSSCHDPTGWQYKHESKITGHCSQNIDPTLLLAVFLPVLLFASAFIAHWHTVRRQAGSILLLVRVSQQLLLRCARNHMADKAHSPASILSIPLCLQAFPGVLIAMGSIAVLMRYSFPYGWTWTQALLFGAMMAATDPVATIAVLGSVSMAVF